MAVENGCLMVTDGSLENLACANSCAFVFFGIGQQSILPFGEKEDEMMTNSKPHSLGRIQIQSFILGEKINGLIF